MFLRTASVVRLPCEHLLQAVAPTQWLNQVPYESTSHAIPRISWQASHTRRPSYLWLLTQSALAEALHRQ